MSKESTAGREPVQQGGAASGSGEGGADPLWRTLGLRQGEYDRICQILGREPNEVELGMFAVLWSEHCAYKHSRPLLKTLPTEGEHLLLGPGENAAVVDLGDTAVAFRIESHNHPTAVDPFQGAATGVGGIIRDVLAVGARPVALLSSVRFGFPSSGRAQELFAGAVAGMAHYSGRVGVPMVGVEAVFDAVYDDKPLVNVLCVGAVPKHRLTRARASGVGNALMIVGGATRRDGILGASFASDELPVSQEEGEASVQVGDPDTERRLIEACQEIVALDGVVGIQDMGAAGITSSVSETAFRAGSGAEIDVTKVPTREPGMTPYEIMLSESQERMLIVVEKGMEEAVLDIARRWRLEAAVIGRVTDDGMLRVKQGNAVVAEVPAAALADGAPTYRPKAQRPAYLDSLPRFQPETTPLPDDWAAALKAVLASPNVASKAWVYRQLEAAEEDAGREGTSPSGTGEPGPREAEPAEPGTGAAVVPVPGSSRAVAVGVAGPGRWAYLDPFTGAAAAAAQAARRVVCAGARPLALTNGLNLGNPEKPEGYWQLTKVVEGIGEAAKALDIPVGGGNVSLYNETAAGAVYPTPIVGVVGVLERGAEGRVPAYWEEEGLALLVLGDEPRHLGGSEYLALKEGGPVGPAPHLDLGLEKRLYALAARLHEKGMLRAAADVGSGGLLASVVVMAAPRGIGVELTWPAAADRPDVLLFGEGGSRIVAAVKPEDVPVVQEAAAETQVGCVVAGRTGGQRLKVTVGGDRLMDAPLADLLEAWRGGLEAALASAGGTA